MPDSTPIVVVIGEPNGAGKTTIAREVLAETLGITEFVNADAIAQGLSGFAPDRAAFAAGRIMLERLRELAGRRESFGFESTLASRTFAPWLASLASSGYRIDVAYVWLRSPDLAVRRVRARVRRGGHSIPEYVVVRRYWRSIANFWMLYRPRATTWRVYDNSGRKPALRGSGRGAEGSPEILLAFLESVHEAVRRQAGGRDP